MRFLLSRRWVLFGLVVALLASLAWYLGEWQFGRLDERRDRNALVRAAEDAPPVPVDDLMSVDEPVAPEDEWRRVTATGEYAVSDTVVVRYRTREGRSGVDLVVPLVTDDGTALLVDRGWLATRNSGIDGSDLDALPAPPAGEVTITGWVRRDATGDATSVTAQSTRAVSSEAIGDALDREVYAGFVDLVEESPAPEDPLAAAELPDLDDGPHFFYGLQWWFFGLLALVGFGYLAYDEWRRATGRKAPPAPRLSPDERALQQARERARRRAVRSSG